ncbi:LysE family translocator [Pseudoalteromonas piratica]|uniref:Flagellar biosynthesis anti-sigma factor FlgM n=1 Tax=Pseudoalteromonas piratica TaxID=1348114 RepID=A0A0A7EMP7_9GAMM|nr:LysE family translocator [Pseudoalteromonas piratica]AIY67227.1 flagellar biosynthesis anti-sigma factor FlgM [Pseudoalteromonas piratica]
MDLSILTLYFVSVFILTASPGPSALLCMTKAVNSGQSAATYAAMGSLCAITLILSASFMGLGVLIATSELAFNVIKWLGAGYLVYLGIKALLSDGETLALSQSQKCEKRNRFSHFLNGFIVGASNPKAIIFFTALFPQFINPDGSLLNQYVIFTSTFVVLELSWLMAYVFLGIKSSQWLFTKARLTLFNRLSGSVFIGAGSLLTLSNRS